MDLSRFLSLYNLRILLAKSAQAARAAKREVRVAARGIALVPPQRAPHHERQSERPGQGRCRSACSYPTRRMRLGADQGGGGGQVLVVALLVVGIRGPKGGEGLIGQRP